MSYEKKTFDYMSARWAVFGLAGLTAAIGTAILARILVDAGPLALTLAATTLFLIGTGWIALAFWTAIAGFIALHTGSRAPAPPHRPLPGHRSSKTVVAIAIHNEDPTLVAANIATMVQSVRAAGRGDSVDFFILSDTTDPDIWVAEERIWTDLCRGLDGVGKIFYRKRVDTTGRKSGNIAEFCRRWGRRYRYMVVLDADSLMEGQTIAALIDRMDGAPTMAMIQTAPVIVNGRSLFNRLLQFAGGTYGRVFSAGLAIISGPHGNSWGHNAIIRVDPFLRHCGLPRLRGKPPMGGDILSHDFVEAALLIRGGWDVRIDPDLGGSFEESPATIDAFTRRDRRWCQGNLQHLRVILTRGFRAMSRYHLLAGIMSYAIAPVWFGFIAIGLILESIGSTPAGTLSLISPLLIFVLTLLIGPRLVGLVDALLVNGRGRLAVVVSTPLEILLTALLAPILMIHQCLAVFSVFRGHAVGWTAQRRMIPASFRRDQIRLAGPPFVIGVIMIGFIGVNTGRADDLLSTALIWGLPVAIPLVAAPILIPIADSEWVGRLTQRLGLFTSPAERIVPPVVASALAARHTWARPIPGDGLAAVLRDPILNAVHRRVLSACSPATAAAAGEERSSCLGDARRRLALGLPLDQAAKMALLTDPASVLLPHPDPMLAPAALGSSGNSRRNADTIAAE